MGNDGTIVAYANMAGSSEKDYVDEGLNQKTIEEDEGFSSKSCLVG